MHATVHANKTYYITANVGLSGLRFIPIKANESNPITNKNISFLKDNAIAWANQENTRSSIQRHITRGLAQWNELSSEDQIILTILPEDGR